MSQVQTCPKYRKRAKLPRPVSRRVEGVLRDAAFVMAMTRRVKESMLTGKPLSGEDASLLGGVVEPHADDAAVDRVGHEG